MKRRTFIQSIAAILLSASMCLSVASQAQAHTSTKLQTTKTGFFFRTTENLKDSNELFHFKISSVTGRVMKEFTYTGKQIDKRKGKLFYNYRNRDVVIEVFRKDAHDNTIRISKCYNRKRPNLWVTSKKTLANNTGIHWAPSQPNKANIYADAQKVSVWYGNDKETHKVTKSFSNAGFDTKSILRISLRNLKSIYNKNPKTFFILVASYNQVNGRVTEAVQTIGNKRIAMTTMGQVNWN